MLLKLFYWGSLVLVYYEALFHETDKVVGNLHILKVLKVEDNLIRIIVRKPARYQEVQNDSKRPYVSFSSDQFRCCVVHDLRRDINSIYTRDFFMQLRMCQVNDLHHGNVCDFQWNRLIGLKALKNDKVLGGQILVDNLARVEVTQLRYNLRGNLPNLIFGQTPSNVRKHVQVSVSLTDETIGDKDSAFWRKALEHGLNSVGV